MVDAMGNDILSEIYRVNKPARAPDQDRRRGGAPAAGAAGDAGTPGVPRRADEHATRPPPLPRSPATIENSRQRVSHAILEGGAAMGTGSISNMVARDGRTGPLTDPATAPAVPGVRAAWSAPHGAPQNFTTDRSAGWPFLDFHDAGLVSDVADRIAFVAGQHASGVDPGECGAHLLGIGGAGIADRHAPRA